MKTNILTLVVLGFAWILFIVWDLFVTQWSYLKSEHIFRVDLLIIFPSLQIITIYTLIKIFRKTKTTD